MKKIRIGNDIHFKWMITRDGVVESFDGKQVDVELRDQTGRRWPVKWSINAGDGCVDGIFYGHMQQAAGTYSLTLTENRGGKEMATVDRTAAWQLVTRQDNACEGTDEGALGVTVEQMASEINVGKAEGVTVERVAQGVKSGEWLNLKNGLGTRSLCCGYLNTEAHGKGSLAFGVKSHAYGQFSCVLGWGITSYTSDSFSFGIQNYEISNAIFCCGVGSNVHGTHLNSEVTLHTEDDKNGYKYFLGVGGYEGQDIKDGMKSLQEVVGDLESKISRAKKTKREKRYVIGRAIKPRSCEDVAHENIYCYGGGGSAFHLYIKEDFSLRLFIDDVEYIESDMYKKNGYTIYPRQPFGDKSQLIRVNNDFLTAVVGYSVDRYEENDKVLSLWLTCHALPFTLHSDSTHHSFLQGRRKYVGTLLQKNLFFSGLSPMYIGNGSFLESDLYINDDRIIVRKCLKKDTVYGYKRRFSLIRNKLCGTGHRRLGGEFCLVERHRFFEKRKTKAVYIDLRRMYDYEKRNVYIQLRKVEKE